MPRISRTHVFVVFGHVADSNIHVNVMPKVFSPEIKKAVEKVVYERTAALGGTVSAEHGIGRHKRPYLSMTRTPPELALMATIKQALDPKGVLNPGRVL